MIKLVSKEVFSEYHNGYVCKHCGWTQTPDRTSYMNRPCPNCGEELTKVVGRWIHRYDGVKIFKWIFWGECYDLVRFVPKEI